MENNVKIGLDFHGVITSNPVFFSRFSKVFCQSGNEVHIITGSRITSDFLNKLKDYDIEYTHLFSISDYHYNEGTAMTGYDKDQTEIDEDTWDRTKAQYCKEMKIDLHIDDSVIYGRYFSTPFALLN
jgi:hypothetical protein